jgi:hypothetical protein
MSSNWIDRSFPTAAQEKPARPEGRIASDAAIASMSRP